MNKVLETEYDKVENLVLKMLGEDETYVVGSDGCTYFSEKAQDLFIEILNEGRVLL